MFWIHGDDVIVDHRRSPYRGDAAEDARRTAGAYRDSTYVHKSSWPTEEDLDVTVAHELGHILLHGGTRAIDMAPEHARSGTACSSLPRPPSASGSTSPDGDPVHRGVECAAGAGCSVECDHGIPGRARRR